MIVIPTLLGTRAGGKPRPCLAALMLCAVLLQACATHPEGVLSPIGGPEPGATLQSLLVVSTRQPSSHPGEVYTGARGDGSSLSVIEVSIPPNHRAGRLEWPRRAVPDPSREFATLSVTGVNEDGAREWFSRQDADGRVVVFVHGFNTPFDGAVYRFAQLNHDARTGGASVLFTWPSRGSMTAYVYDRESANFSRDALEHALRLIVQSPDVREVTILAHSMGTWVAMEALRQYAIRDGRVDPKIDNVILAAPDLDVDVFRQQFRALGEERPRFMILISRDDRALRFSRFLAGGVSRVGAVDLAREPYRSELEKMDDVTIVDLSRMATGDRLNHSTFATSPEVVRLIGSQLMAGQTLEAGRGHRHTHAGAVVLALAESVEAKAAAVADHEGAATAPRP